MAAGTPREAVLNMLDRVFREKCFLAEISDAECAELSERDRAFAMRLSLTVLEKKTAIDAVLETFLKTPLRKVKPKVRLILETGCAEILYFGSAPYAAVNEAVSLSKKVSGGAYASFVNAVLRNVARAGQERLAGLDRFTALGIPESIKERFVSWYGEERGYEILRAMTDEQRRTVIRRNRFFASEEELLTEAAKDGLNLTETGLLDGTYTADGENPAYRAESFKKGLFYIQDLSSCMDIASVADIAAGNTAEGRDFRVLDVSASPGGKLLQFMDLYCSAHAAEGGSVKIRADACDLTEGRLELIRENLKRMPYPGVTLYRRDAAEHVPEYEGVFDLVIADLPCSGLGTLKKNPELLYRTDEKSLSEIAALQRRILDNIASYVRPGGALLYSTCTVNPAENGMQVDRFLKAHPEFSAAAFSDVLPEVLRASVKSPGRLQILPDVFPGDGFYIARLQKRSVP